MMKRMMMGMVVGTVAVLFVASTGLAQMSFTSLGFYEGGTFSRATGVSADGSTVAGMGTYNASGYYEAFLWTQSTGKVRLGDLAGGNFYSRALGISSDGSTVVGYSSSSNAPHEAFRWTQSGGMVGLGDLSGGGFYSDALAVSADGTRVVGYSTISGDPYNPPFGSSEAFLWTQSGGMVGLGDLEGGGFSSRAESISGGGSTVVGYSESGSGTEAFRWTQSEGMIGLGDLSDSDHWSVGLDISDDGSTIVGSCRSLNGTEAFRWTQSGGMVGLGDLPGGSFYSRAEAVSGDGSTVVGYSSEGLFVWDSINGMQSLTNILQDGGIDMIGWDLVYVDDISCDGKTIVGKGSYLGGNQEAFVAVIPEPSSLAMIWLVGGCAVFIRRFFCI